MPISAINAPEISAKGVADQHSHVGRIQSRQALADCQVFDKLLIRHPAALLDQSVAKIRHHAAAETGSANEKELQKDG